MKQNIGFNTKIENCYDENLLKESILMGLGKRNIEITLEVQKRIELEWNTFKENDQLNRLFIVYDLMSWAKNNNIKYGSGRGASCGSLILYALGITDINPLTYNLIFERMGKVLDIDIDSESPAKMVDYLKSKYGKENVLRVAYHRKENSLTKQTKVNGVKQTSDSLYIHACKIVIFDQTKADLPIIEINGEKVFLCDNEEIKRLNIFDLDILGLNILKKIENCKDLIYEKYGKTINFNADNCDDAKTFKLFSDYDVEEVFAFCRNNDIKKFVIKHKINSLTEISAVSVLSISDTFGKIDDKEIHRMLEPYLKETYGLFLYQEQMLEILYNLMGFTYSEAESIRQFITKPKNQYDIDYKAMFFEKACKKYSKDIADRLWVTLCECGKKTYLKAHFISYAYMSYQTAYLKANYKAEFDKFFYREKI